jgi:site-specific recombinase XerC
LDTARAVLGHSNLNTTEIYAERDREKAAEVMEQVG